MVMNKVLKDRSIVAERKYVKNGYSFLVESRKGFLGCKTQNVSADSYSSINLYTTIMQVKKMRNTFFFIVQNLLSGKFKTVKAHRRTVRQNGQFTAHLCAKMNTLDGIWYGKDQNIKRMRSHRMV